MFNKDEQLIWAVVEVRSGIPLDVALFREFESAKLYNWLLRCRLNLEMDETGIFPVNVSDIVYEEEKGKQGST